MAKTRRSRIDDLIDEQSVELAQLHDREVAKFLRAYEDSRRELRDRLASTPADQEFTRQRLRVALAQTEAGVRSMQDRLGAALDASTRRTEEKALANLIATVKKAEPAFKDAGGRVEVGTLRRLAEDQGLALHRYSVQRYGAQLVDAIQRELVVGVTQGLTVRELADRIAGTDRSVFDRARGRAELIARMELARAHDAGAQFALEELAATDPPDHPDPLLKKADEFFDNRNHPFSRALHGRAVLPRQEWEVPVSAIPGGSTSGVVWQRTGSVVHGFGYPAHFHDRGRQIPWRESWGPCIRQESFRVEKTTLAERRGLRALRDGKPPRLSPPERRNLELAGLIDGQGRVTLDGQRTALREGWQGRRTHPGLQPDPQRRADGDPPRMQGDSDKKRALRRQIETADAMARAGWRVAHRPEAQSGKNPNLIVEGRVFDVYAPTSKSAAKMASVLKDKVKTGQAVRFVINTQDTPLGVEEIRTVFLTDRFAFAHINNTVEVLLFDGERFFRVVG